MNINNETQIGTYIFELTNRCNESCAFCYAISFDSNMRRARIADQLTDKEWISGLENIVQEDAKAVDLSGGEPTLYSNFPVIIERAKDLGLYVIVSTNGTTHKRDNVRNALEKYADCIALSIHGVEDLHDHIKGRQGSYETIIESYKHYSAIGKKMKINTVVCKDNLHDLIDIGEALDIEHSQSQWKLSQAISRESGRTNRKLVHVSNEEFDNVSKEVTSRFQKAYSEGRITFREDDSQVERFQFAPYVIVSSDGEMHIPIGEQHIKLGVSVLDSNYYVGLSKVFDSLGNFPEKVNRNHEKFYGSPDKQIKDSLPVIQPLNKPQGSS
ncbi:radical SAM protein [Candidatus Pacearchaeota archaeon]|nr:radical SAM protein [Candidatus Pacearchaeota archaeon]